MTQLAPIETADYSEEMYEAFRQFGTYANFARAFPNVLDGLKPVHRRIIWAMWHMNARHNSRFVKSMRAVGETVGKYHPHGDSAVYSTMAGMAQDFTRMMPLISGQGNWGSLAFAPAASRYTECRLTLTSAALLGMNPTSGSVVLETDEDTVQMSPNYSGEFQEPIVLPALMPNFVINGYQGIGVGIAGNSPSHNITETLKLAKRMVLKPDISVEAAMKVLPGPDVPSDCDIFESSDGSIRDYFVNGYGSFVMRARWDIEEEKPSARSKQVNKKIIVTGLPYQTSPEDVFEGVQDMIDRELLPPNISVVNATSKKGTRVVIDVGPNDVDDIVQRLLYHSKKSSMQKSFSVSMTAISDGQIQTVGVLDALRKWVHHRRSVVRRRSAFRRDKAAARLHLVQGFIKAVPIAEEIVSIVRAADNKADASDKMQTKWQFSEIQANAILEMTIGQITKLGTDRFVDESRSLQDTIDECTEILTNDDTLKEVIRSEIDDMIKTFGVPRRNNLRLGESPFVDRPESPAVEIPAVPGYLAITEKGWVRWIQRNQITRKTGGDYVSQIIPCTDQNRIEVVTNYGWHIRALMDSVPKNLTNVKAMFVDHMETDEVPLLIGTAAPIGPCDIVMVTDRGAVKRVGWDDWASAREYKNRPLIGTEDGEMVEAAFFLKEGQEIAILTKYGRMVRFAEEDLTAKGRGAKGIAGIRLEDDPADGILWAGAVSPDDEIVYRTSKNKIGSFKISSVRRAARGGRGQVFAESANLIIDARLVADEETRFNYYGPEMNDPISIDLNEIPSSGGMDVDSEGLSIKKVPGNAIFWVE